MGSQDTRPNRNYPRIGIVLSSGGVGGVYAHTGFLQAIEELNFPIAAMAGCSAGAIVGGIVASGTPLQQWATTLENMQQNDFWNPDFLPRMIWQMVRNQGRGYSGLSETETALQFCRKHLNAERFDQSRDMDQVLQGPWSLLEVVDRVLYRNRLGTYPMSGLPYNVVPVVVGRPLLLSNLNCRNRVGH